MSCSVVENPDASTGYIDVAKLLDQDTWNKYRGFAYNKIDENKIYAFQDELSERFQEKIGTRVRKDDVIYHDDWKT